MITTRRILRFNIRVNDETITLPAGPVVHVAPDRTFTGPGNLEVWIESTTDNEWPNTGTHGEQDILVVPTGGEIPEGAVHLASVINTPMVWHLYRTCSCDFEELYAHPGRTADFVRRVRISSCPNHPEDTP